jgi:hypothetical protein
MTSKFKYFAALLVIIAVIFACSSNKDKDKQNTQNQQKQYKDTVQINKDQYRIAENFVGPKNQIIDLLQDTVTFDITHQGTGPFKCTLSYPDGKVLSVLADVTGNFKGKKELIIPETRAYVLDVETQGTWSVYRE